MQLYKTFCFALIFINKSKDNSYNTEKVSLFKQCIINIQHKLRECLSKNRPARNELGVRIPVVACVKDNNHIRYVRLGDQFCVRDTDLALDSLSKNSFIARASKSLVI